MNLCIDGHAISALVGQTLGDLVHQLGLDSKVFADRPIAAKIAGEVFNLNYVPVRRAEEDCDRQSVRRAMAASNGNVSLLRYCDPVGRDVYTRTAQFGIFLALHRRYPNARAKMNCTVGRSLFVEVMHPDFSANILKEELQHLVSLEIPLKRRRVTTDEAIRAYESKGWHDKAKLLAWRGCSYFDEYYFEDFADYYYGELAPSLGYLQVWDILPSEGGFMFMFPEDTPPFKLSEYEICLNF